MLGMWAKWQRGSEQILYLKSTNARFASGNTNPPFTPVHRHIDLEDKALVFTVGPEVPPIAPDTTFVAAEAAHHLRSALNYLVIELAWIDTRGDIATADKRQEFPFAADPTKWREKRVQKVCLRGLNKRHRAMIQRFQPYRPWPRPAGDPHPAEMLQALTNDDKHHLLLRDAFPRLGTVRPVRMQRVGYNCRVNSYQLRSMTQRQWVTALMRELKPNTELFRVPLVITGPNPKIDMDIEGATYVAIGPGLSVVNQLVAIANMVKRILDLFEPDFDRPIAKRIWRERPWLVDALPPPLVSTPARRLRDIRP